MLEIPDSDGAARNLLTECVILTEQETRDHALTDMNDPNRRVQNSFQMHIFLAKSLTNEGHIKIMQEADSYRSKGIAIGALYFKLLTSKAVVDTRSTASYLRENLTSLESCVASVNSNVDSFKLYVKENRQGLKVRGERMDNIMMNLFKGYMDEAEKDFVH